VYLTALLIRLTKTWRNIARSPRTVRDFVAAEVEASASNYLLSWFAFGDMTVAESLRSIELFAREVMPAFANVHADAAE